MSSNKRKNPNITLKHTLYITVHVAQQLHCSSITMVQEIAVRTENTGESSISVDFHMTFYHFYFFIN